MRRTKQIVIVAIALVVVAATLTGVGWVTALRIRFSEQVDDALQLGKEFQTEIDKYEELSSLHSSASWGHCSGHYGINPFRFPDGWRVTLHFGGTVDEYAHLGILHQIAEEHPEFKRYGWSFFVRLKDSKWITKKPNTSLHGSSESRANASSSTP